MNTLIVIGVVILGIVILTETVLKKTLINISDKIVDIIEALNKKYK